MVNHILIGWQPSRYGLRACSRGPGGRIRCCGLYCQGTCDWVLRARILEVRLRLCNVWDARLDTQTFGLKLLFQGEIQPCSHRSLREGAKVPGVCIWVSIATANRLGGVSVSWHWLSIPIGQMERGLQGQSVTSLGWARLERNAGATSHPLLFLPYRGERQRSPQHHQPGS